MTRTQQFLPLFTGQHVLERSSVVIHPDGAVEARFTGGQCGAGPQARRLGSKGQVHRLTGSQVGQ